MGRKKAETPPEKTTEEVLGWAMVLNCEADVDRDKAEAAARSVGLRYYVHGQDVYAVGYETVVGDAAALDDGVLVVTRDGRGNFVRCEVRRRTVFVVQSIAWEYNDENHYTVGENAGHADRVFEDEAKAKAYADEQNVRGRMDLDDIGDYLDRYSECVDWVTMDYEPWTDWLRDRGIEPPGAGVGRHGEPDLDDMDAWWTAGRGGRRWDQERRQYVEVKGAWTESQWRDAARHLAVDFYRVVETEVGGG